MTRNSATFPHPDQALIHGFRDAGGSPIAMDSNPLSRALRARLLSVDAASHAVELEFDPDPLFVQGGGVLQGGAVTAMLDFAMAFAVLACLPAGVSCSTVNLNTSFLRPAPEGRYRAAGLVDRCGKGLAFASASLCRAADGVVVATATSTLAIAGR